jgi:outer membrane protein insertion porin family
MKKTALLNYLFALLCLVALFPAELSSQVKMGNSAVSYASPVEYKIAGITVVGAKHTDVLAIKLYAGIQVGDQIAVPGDKITKAITNLWNQNLFDDVAIYIAEIRDSEIYLVIEVKEVPVLAKFTFEGVSKAEGDNLKEETKMIRGMMVNKNLLNTIHYQIKKYYIDKGFLNANTKIKSEDDPSIDNGVFLTVSVDKGPRTKISEIVFNGAEKLTGSKLSRALKNTKKKRWWSIFKASKFVPSEYSKDKQNLIAKYNGAGFRDAKILQDTTYKTGKKTIGLRFDIVEGNKYYFRDISFTGNQKYSSEELNKVLGINRGDVYNIEALQERVLFSAAGTDVSSLYQDDGYLNFRAIPLEVAVEQDSIDIEILIDEGKQFRIGKVSIRGNTKTNDHVVFREIRTRPGDLFSRTDVIRTQRELAQLGYFNPEAFDVKTSQRAEEGLVDMEFILEEKPSDQIELSGGWGGGRVVGTLGVSFTNFSLRKFFDGSAWSPVPTGDGQRLSLRAQSNGSFFQSYNLAFTEPWLGGRKPNSLSFSLTHSIQTNGQRKKIDDEINPLRQALLITGASVGLGKRLLWPDDFFSLFTSLSFQHFNLKNFGSFFTFANGESNNLAVTLNLQRNSVSEPIFPRYGSTVSLMVKATPPYSSFSGERDFAAISDQDKFRWIEYHKWKFTVDWYTPLSNDKKLVLNSKMGMGFLGLYNRDIGVAPFERFYMGGVFLSGFLLDGREIINLRGYDDLSLSPSTGSSVITKYGTELRYLISPNPNAQIFALAFAEAGKTWDRFSKFNPFEVYRSGGLGLRIFLPMFGLLGLDYGWRFDEVPNLPQMAKGQFHFSIGMNLGDL